jgi:hypothetical protein
MDFPVDQLEELKQLAPGVARADEGGHPFFLLPNLTLPAGCTPPSADCLLSPQTYGGYPSRLYFSHMVKSGPNWNAQNAQILGRNWHAYSWQTNKNDLRLAQLVMDHLRALG